jgi:hypothetical protein
LYTNFLGDGEYKSGLEERELWQKSGSSYYNNYGYFMIQTAPRKQFIFLLLGVMLILLGFGYSTGFFFLSGITPCLPPPGMAVDGLASARVYTWLDINRNGSIDTDETILPNIEIKYPPSYPNNTYTGKNGRARVDMFKPGCVCNCWENEYVEVVSPNGYRPTTPLRKELTGDNLLYEFGFVTINP